MIPARQSTALEIAIGPVLDADGVAVTDCVVGDFKIKKTTGNFAALNGSATLTHVSAGVYDLVLTTSDTDTVGIATIAIDDTVNACALLHLQVMEEAIYDALYAASANAFAGSAGSTTLGTGAITAGVIANGAIDAATFAADVDAEILSYLVDDATRIDASALNTATGTTIPAILDDTDLIDDGTSGLAKIATDVAAILVDTAEIGAAGAGLTALATAANLATVAGYLDTEIAAILADTNELQTDWANGGRLDLLIDGIKAKTDSLTFTVSSVLDTNMLRINGTSIAGTGTRVADSFVAMLNVASPVFTVASVNQTGDSYAVVNSGTFGNSALKTLIDDVPTNAELATSQAAADDATLAAIATAQADLDILTGTDGATLATSQPNYAPATAAALASLVTTVGVAGAGLTEAGGTGDHLTAVPWNPAWDAEVQSEVTDAIVAHNLDHLCLTATAAADMTAEVADNTILARILSNGDTSVFDPSTDGLQPIRDRGDVAWVTATGFSTLDEAGVRSAVGLASANLDTQLGDLPTVAEFEARTLVAADYGTAANQTAIKAKTDNLPSDPADQSSVEAAITQAVADLATAHGAGSWATATSVTVSDKTGFSLASSGLDLVLVESGISAGAGLTNDTGTQLTGINARQALALIASACGAVLAGAATTNVTIKPAGKPAGNTRLDATVDSDGNRTTVNIKVPD